MSKAKKRVNSCAKGKAGELKLVEFLRSIGFEDARRTQQHNGAAGKSDVVCEETLPNVHLECKYGVKGMDLGTKLLDDACDQAASDSATPKWCVFWKPFGRSTWFMTCSIGNHGIVTLHHESAIARRLTFMNEEAY